MSQFESVNRYGREYSPPWIRRGGRDLKKISRSLLCGSGRGGWFKLPIIGGLNQPPRLRELMWLREIFLIAQPPLLIQGGEYASTPSARFRKLLALRDVRPGRRHDARNGLHCEGRRAHRTARAIRQSRSVDNLRMLVESRCVCS